jgi:hypothetical protein
VPETNIDQSAGITSIRLKVPTGTVPIPPAGFGQLHSPSPGTLALRMPDGSVIEIGAAVGSPHSIAGTGGGVNADSAPGIIDGLTIAVPSGKHLWLNVPDVLFGPDQVPFGGRVATVVLDQFDIEQLHVTPVTLVAVTDPAKVVCPRAITFRPNNGAGYTSGGSLPLLALAYAGTFTGDPDTDNFITDVAEQVLLADAPTVVDILPAAGVFALDDIVGKALQFYSYLPLTGGTRQLTITTEYVLR